jgi:hypothetical protein
MNPIILFLINNLGTIETLITEIAKMFPAKTGAAQVGAAITSHPDAVAALQNIATQYSTLNK